MSSSGLFMALSLLNLIRRKIVLVFVRQFATFQRPSDTKSLYCAFFPYEE